MSFRVPEEHRIRTGPMGSDFTNGKSGAFAFASVVPGRALMVVASDGADWEKSNLKGPQWEHVSARAICGNKDYTPSWNEMCQVKATFWDPDDVVIQFHPAASNYVNKHPHVLHLWRIVGGAFPLPDIGAV